MKKTFTKNIFKVGFGILIFLLTNHLKAQNIQVTNTANISSAYDPITLISNVFIGQGMDIDTIIYEGDPQQVGYFQNGGAAVGIADGILITNGNAEDAQNPNTAGGTTTNYGTTNTTSPLSTVVAGAGNDIAQYTIVFTPTSSTLTFNYVFGSEEYPEWVGSAFNDVFGFFISGPNNTGPFSNIALLPGSTTPVSINSVNAGSNASYYVTNNGTLHEYDATTTVLTATANVTPCQQYTIILAISDVGDWSLDSGVFLEGGSFEVDGIVATPVTPSPDTVLVEGCAAGVMEFSLNAVASSSTPITYSVGGTATMGIDYDSIPISGVISPGQSTFTIPIIPLNDGVADGQEYIEFIFNTNPCTVDTVRIYIKDNDLVTNINDAFICAGDSVTLDATAPVTIPPPYTFMQSDTLTTIEFAQVQSNLNVSGFPFPQVTAGMIESVCLDITHISPADLDIFLLAPDGSFLELTTDNGQIGNNFGQACFTANPTDPNINGSNSPFSGTYQPEGFWQFLYGAPVNGTWQLLVTDDAAFLDGTINSWSINFAPIYDLQYSWTPTTNINYVDSPVVVVSPPVTTDYIVDITDTYGCVVSDTATITVDNQIPAPIISCGNINNSSLEFVWQPITNVTAYEVNVNGTGWVPANGTLSHLVTGLPSLTTVTIEVRAIAPLNSICTLPPLIGTHSCTTTSCALTTNILSQTDVTCFGGTDGSVTIDIPAGVPPYSHTMNGGTPQTSTTFSNLAVGSYTIVSTDSINCQTTLNVLISEPTEVTGTIATTDVSCNGGNDGTATITPSGGANTTYTYSWSTTPIQTTQTATGLSAGTYFVTISDANSCTGIVDTTIIEPTLLTVSMDSIAALCNGGNDGQAIATPAGGIAPYTYTWSHDATLNSDTASALSTGTYTVTVTDANMCTTTGTVIINEPTAITLSTTSTDATCNSSGDGTATVTATGGTPGYTYLWDANAANQITSTANGLNQGTFIVNVTDGNGCIETATATVNVPSPIVLSMASTDLSCFGASDGTATVTATGGAGNYTYAWNTTPTQTTQTATGLSAGTTIVTVTDANGCFDTAQAQITGQVVMTIGFTTTDVSCNNGNDGTATVNITNGNSPFNYTWNTNTPQTTQTATTLTTGTYTVTIVDNIGCIGIDSTTVNEPTALTSTTSSTILDCSGDGTGTATVTVGGGTSGYTYNWSTTPAQTTQTATGLQAGTYFVTSTDANMCTIIDTVTVTEPTPIILTMSNSNVSCNGANDGTASVTAIGGTGVYTYNWNTIPAQTTQTANSLSGGLYEVTVTDANLCTATDTVSIYEPPLITYTTASTNVSCFGGNDGTITITNTTVPSTVGIQYSIDGGTTFQATNTFTGLTAGTYTPVCSFSNGNCPITETDIVITQPDSITLTTTSTDITCNGVNDGTATATASGGTGVLTYAWSTTPVQTTANITNLAAGTYFVTVTDNNLCSTVDSVTIAEPLAITYATTPTNLSCNNDNSGSIVLTASGGTGTLTYNWSNNETTATISNLAAGTYIFTITDASNCFVIDSTTITEPTVLTSSTTSTDISCFSANDGTGTVTPAGGTTPYTYLWSNGMSGATATGLGVGTAYVTITDANLCTTIDSVIIIEPTQIITNVTGTDATCNGLTDGTAIIIATGGVPNYTYTWDGVLATDTVTNLGAGWHYVLVTDATGCTALDSILTNEPAPIILSTSMTSVSCSGGNDGTATVTATGGAGGFSYQWNTSPAQFTATATNLTTGTFIVTVTDANGCFNVDSIVVTTPNPLVNVLSETNVDCFGASTGSISTATTGGVSPYTYAWSNGATTPNLINIPAGIYTVTITDANGCNIDQTIDIIQPAAPIMITLDKIDVKCNGVADGIATANVTGGTAPYQYSWNTTPQQVTPVAAGLPAGTYTVTVTDANGCQQVASIAILQPTNITATISEQGASCFGGTDGTATVVANGGTPGYNYVWNTVPQQVGTTATNLTGGQSYTVTVTDSSGCSITQNITITQPAEITLTTTQTDITCNGFTDGTATVLPTGGTPSYTYLWDANANNQTTDMATNLGLGGYSVTVTDANGCTATTTVTIVEPNPLFMNLNKTDVLCKGEATGTALATFSGGSEPYSPIWSYNNTAANNINNLPAGTYYLTLTDGNSCQLTDSITVEEPTDSLALSTETVDNLCFGDRDGEIRINGTGGTYPYQFSLDGQSYSNSNRFVGLEADNYTIFVRDANGCLYNEDITITQPDEFTIEAINDLDIEFGDAAVLDVTASNGANPIMYVWTPAAFLSCSDCQSPVADSLSVDTYFEVFATDNNGCTAESGMYVRVNTPRYVFIANGFTPNDDGNNDVLYVQGGRGTVEVLSFQVFDRWGELVYQTMNSPLNDENFGWDGTYKGQDMNGGVFVWAVEVLFEDGKTVTYKGSTVLIR
jgi:gliding motility-associated-like protein